MTINLVSTGHLLIDDRFIRFVFHWTCACEIYKESVVYEIYDAFSEMSKMPA